MDMKDSKALSSGVDAHNANVDTLKLTVYFRKGLTLPLRTGPIRFAVVMENGLTSHSWGVRTERKGDAYVFCRESMTDVKVSLHTSGQQRIAFTKESGHVTASGTRLWNQWLEPPQQRPPVPSLMLLFPDWATTLGPKDVQPGRPKWHDNQILIEGDTEYVTSVWVFVVDEGQHLVADGVPSKTLGVLPLRTGKELQLIACKERMPWLKKSVETTTARAVANAPASEKMLGLLTCLLAGDDRAGCPYLLPVLLDGKLRVSEDAKGSAAYGMCMRALVEKRLFRDPETWEELPPVLRQAWNTGSPETGVGGLRPVGSADKGGAAEERRLGTEVDSRL